MAYGAEERRPRERRWSRSLSALALLAAFATPTIGQIVAPSGRTLFNRGVLVRTVVEYQDVAGADRDGWRARTALVWGARPHLNVGVVAPSIWENDRSGFAEPTIFARYDVFRRDTIHGTTRIAPEIAVKLPTGGELGSGSTDVSGALIFSRIRDPNWLVADVVLKVPGREDEGVRRGDVWRVDLGYLRRLAPRAGPGTPMALGVLELTARWSSRSELGAVALENTGGRDLYISPGLEWIASQRVILELAIPFRVWEDLNGDPPSAKRRVVAGLRWLF